MGYRLYLTSDTAPISITPNTGWEQTSGVTRGLLSPTKAGTNTALAVAETNVAANFDVLIGQWVSLPFIHGGTITLDLHSLCVARNESDAAANFETRWVLRVVAPDGTFRDDGAFTSAVEWSTTLTASQITNSTASVTAEVQAGDRFVVEYGYKAQNTVTTSFTGTIRHGGTATADLEPGDTGANATTRSPWVEFDDPAVADLFAPPDPTGGYRLYLTSSAAPISPTAAANWEDTTQVTRGLLSTTKAGANGAISASETSASASHDTLIGQWISAPITSARTLEGDYSLTIARMESDAAADFVTTVIVRVLSSDGSVVRGTYEAATLTAPTFSTEYPTSITAETVGPFAGDAVSCQVGDRIVVEIGMRSANTSTTSFTATLRRGGTDTTDLVTNDTGTQATSRSPHIEFHDPDTALLFLDSTGVAAWAGTIGGFLAVEAAFGADLAANYGSWSWTDITSDVRYDGGVELVHGRGDEASASQPAQCRVVLDNRAGAYSLGPQASNYPHIRRGTPIRVLADLDDGAGWRILFWGAADAWNPSWVGGPSGDATVTLTASGALRRLLQGAQPVLSTYRRALTADTSTVAYWPMEDGPNADSAASAFPDHPPITYTNALPEFGATSGFPCSAAMVGLNSGRLVAEVPPYTFGGEVQIRWLASFPNSALDDESVIMRAYLPGGTAALWEVIYDSTAAPEGGLKVFAFDETGTSILTSANVDFEVNGKNAMMTLELTQDGADVDWELNVFGVTAPVNLTSSGTVAGETLSAVTFVEFGPNADIDSLSVGHLSIHDSITSVFSDLASYRAFRYETVADRLQRLCDENSTALQLVGASDVVMGPQHPDGFVELLRECEIADQGVLYDGLRPGVTYVCRSAREALAADLTLDAAQGQVDELIPVDDDQRTRNLAVVDRREGSSAVYEDSDGRFGTATIGIYDESFTVNPGGDAVLTDYASWFVHVGTTVDGDYRHPSLGLQLHRDPSLAADWIGLPLGARIDVTNIDDVRTQHPVGTVSLALEGYTQRINQFTWFVDAVCSPYAPWRVGTLSATSSDTSTDVLRTESSGSTLYAAVTAGASSFQVVTSFGPLWTTTADDFPLTVEIEGTPITVTAISGTSSPQTFTVTGATVVRNLSAAAPVTLWQPRVLGLPEGG